MPTRHQPQLALDETVVDDPELEALLEKRLRAHDDIAEIRLTFDQADGAAKEKIAALELADGMAVRVGRFRVTKAYVAPRSVSFETSASSRLRISLAEED